MDSADFSKENAGDSATLAAATATGTAATAATFPLPYTPPYGFERLLEFFRFRQLAGVELVDDYSYTRTVLLPSAQNEQFIGWIRVENDLPRNQLLITMSASLLPTQDAVLARVRRQFDTSSNPQQVFTAIRTLDKLKPHAAVEGTRVPGAFDPWETTVRAVLGQQVSVQAANRLAARIAERFGTPLDVGIEGLNRTFPSASDFLALDPIEDALGVLGVIKSRSRAIRALAQAVADGSLRFDDAADLAQCGQFERLLAIKGIGSWSANYIAMRTMGYADAFLETDAGVKHALPDLSPKERLAAAEQWRPYRAYANLCLWNSLS